MSNTNGHIEYVTLEKSQHAELLRKVAVLDEYQAAVESKTVSQARTLELIRAVVEMMDLAPRSEIRMWKEAAMDAIRRFNGTVPAGQESGDAVRV